MFNSSFPVPPEERAVLTTSLIDLRADLDRALSTLLREGTISGFDLLVITLWNESWSYQEIADQLGYSKSFIQKCIEHVRNALRDCGLLEGYE